ncbi:MAG: hypothetical protein JXA90_10785 [Planctomycetes bacterium]|nr:hypothetical protein [Planctomycetota bacterium]
MTAGFQSLWALLGASLAEAVTAGGAGDAGAGSSSAAAPDFQAYIFWAYGLACGLIGLFTAATFWQIRRVSDRIAHLEDRFRRAHPEGETRS